MKRKMLGPDQRNAFRDNYLAAIIAVMAFFLSGDLFAQQNDSTRYTNNNSYGTRAKRTINDSLSVIPLYESPHTGYRPGGLYYRKSDSSVYVWTGNQKIKVSGTAGGAGIDTAYTIDDTTIAIETADNIFFMIVRGTPDWHRTGNSGTDPSNFIGTTDERPLRFRTNNVERVIIDSTSGKVAFIHGPDTLFIIPDAENVIQASTGTDISIKTNDLVRLKVTSSGFIGVGGVEPLEMLDVNGNVNARDAFIIYNPAGGTLRGELYHAGTYLGLRTITAHPLVIETDNTERSRYTGDGFFNVAAKTNLIGDATAPVVSDADSSNAIETTGRTKRLIAALETAIPLYTASNGLTKVGNDFRLGGMLLGNTAIATAGYDLNLSGTGRLLVDTGRIVIGIPVDPLYSLSVKKVYDNVTQSNFSTTVGKYPIYADKDVRFTEDSMSMWTVAGDNAGLSILRYKGQSILNFENTVNRFTAHHAVLSLEKHPSFNDTTIFMGRAAPYPAETCVPSGFSAILSQSQSGLNSTKPNISRGWFAALSAEVQMGGGAFNKAENMIWIHTGGIGNAFTGAITNGYGLYINPFGAGVTNKYALYQQGTADTVYLAGKIKMPNLTARTDTTSYKPVVLDANGNLSQLTYWPTGSGGTVTSVGLSMPTGFSVALSPVTTSGTIAVSTTLNGIVIGNGSGFSATTTSAGISGVLSDETGSGSAVFATSPTITTPTISGQILNSADADIAHRRLTNTGTLYGLSLQNSLSQEMGGIKANNSGEVRIGAFRSTWFSTFYSNNTEAARFTTAGLFAIGGGGTSSFPALKNNAGVMEIMKADNSGYASLASLGLTLSGLSGTGTRLGTVSSTGVSGAITNGTDGQVMTMVSGSPAWASAPTGGTYNPTFSNLGTGVSSVTATGSKVWYTRVGNIVTITGRIEPIFSSGTTGDHREFTMSLPPGITANLTDPNDAQGVANCTWSTTRTAMVNWDASNDVIKFDVQIGSEGFSDARAVHFTVTFQIP